MRIGNCPPGGQSIRGPGAKMECSAPHPGAGMPSRRGLALIALFWFATTGYVVYRDVWPRWFGDAPPPVQIDLTDEATLSLPVRWSVYRGDKKIGSLTTRMQYVPADDTFRFISSYRDLVIEVAALNVTLTLVVPALETTTRVTREGELREQSMTGTIEARERGLKLAEAKATVQGKVERGELVGTCRLDSPLFRLDRPLTPVPVPRGAALNPLQPLNRLRDVRPGKRWVIHETNPLFEAVDGLTRELLKQANVTLPAAKRPELIAEVRRSPESLDLPTGRVGCWVIEYRTEQPVARTWVSVDDGRVMQQEAFGMGDLRITRED